MTALSCLGWVGAALLRWQPDIGPGQLFTGLALIVSALALRTSVRNYKHGAAVKSFDIQCRFEELFDSVALREARREIAVWHGKSGGKSQPPEDAANSVGGFFEAVASARRRKLLDDEALFHSLSDASRAYYLALSEYISRYRTREKDGTYFEDWEAEVARARKYAKKRNSATSDGELCQLRLKIDAKWMRPPS